MAPLLWPHAPSADLRSRIRVGDPIPSWDAVKPESYQELGTTQGKESEVDRRYHLRAQHASGKPSLPRTVDLLRGPARARAHPLPAVKNTARGTCGRVQRGWYDRKQRRVRDLACGDLRMHLEVEVRRVACRHCGTVKQERLDFLADNPFYTTRVAFYVGRRCRASPSGTWPRSCASPGTP